MSPAPPPEELLAGIYGGSARRYTTPAEKKWFGPI